MKNFNMPIQKALLIEQIPTVRAFQLVILCMSFQMSPQMITCFESPLTIFMDASVLFLLSLMLKFEFAMVRFLSFNSIVNGLLGIGVFKDLFEVGIAFSL